MTGRSKRPCIFKINEISLSIFEKDFGAFVEQLEKHLRIDSSAFSNWRLLFLIPARLGRGAAHSSFLFLPACVYYEHCVWDVQFDGCGKVSMMRMGNKIGSSKFCRPDNMT